VEAGTHLQQAAHPAVNLGIPLRRLGDAGEHLEQRRLPRPVVANVMPTTSPRCTSKETSFNAQMCSEFGFRNSKFFCGGRGQRSIGKSLTQGPVGRLPGGNAVLLGKVFYSNGDVSHISFLPRIDTNFR
jgi:hypothetical protein